MTPEEVLAGLNGDQRAAVMAQRGPVLITAGPGTGKTRTVTRRIAYGVHAGIIDPPRAMALTFTTRAAGELHRRLAELGAGGVAARTFHSAALRQLRHFWPELIGGEPAKVVANRAPLLQAALRDSGLGVDVPLPVLRTELDWMKALGVDAHDYAERAVGRDLGGLEPADVARVIASYEQVKAARGVIDFDDVLLLTIGLLDSRTDARESVRRQYRWFTVDEYQDVSPLQQRLLDLWLGDRGEVCAVGDPAQAIYSFAGADPSLIATFSRRYPAATVVSLPISYRCAPQVITAANAIARTIPRATVLRPADTAAAGSVQVLQFPHDAAEAAGVAEEISAMVAAGHDPAEIAVLFRINQQSVRIREALQTRGIPFALRGSERYFERPEVREALTRLRGQLRAEPVQTASEAWEAVAAAMNHPAGPPAVESGRDRWESLAALAALAAPDVSGGELLAELDRRAADEDAPRPAGVSVMTLHAAKGLEWDTVFIVGAWDGMLPLAAASAPEQLAEELRLTYVGVTRPRRRLMITWGERGGHGVRRRESPFLVPLGEAHAARQVSSAPSTPADPGQGAADNAGRMLPPARCRVCGRALVTGAERVLGRCRVCPGVVDAAVLAELEAWRARAAAESGLPEYAVLTSVTLQSIAEVQPTSIDELGLIPGITAERLRKHGADLLRIVADAARGGAVHTDSSTGS